MTERKIRVIPPKAVVAAGAAVTLLLLGIGLAENGNAPKQDIDWKPALAGAGAAVYGFYLYLRARRPVMNRSLLKAARLN